jgi:PII-like signaling protein
MKAEGQFHLLRIFVNESDRHEGRALYEVLVRTAREMGMAGATAIRAIEGFGAGGRVHSVKVLHLSEDVPIVVEIIDRPERVAAFLPTVDKLVTEGVVTVEKVHTFTYRRDGVPSEAPQFDDAEIQLDTGEREPIAEAAPVFAEIGDRASEAIESAKKSAASSRRVFVDSIDVLLALLCESQGIAAKALSNLGIECRTLQRTLRDTVSRDETSRTFLNQLQSKSVAAAKWLGHKAVGTEHLLIALCQIRPNAASDILMRLGTQPRDVCKEVLTILDHKDDWQAWIADHPDM